MLLTALWANSQVTAVGACMCLRGFVLLVKLKGEVWGSSAGPVLEPMWGPLFTPPGVKAQLQPAMGRRSGCRHVAWLGTGGGRGGEVL